MTTTRAQLRPDRWFAIDLPVLCAVAETLDHGQAASVEDLHIDGLDTPTVAASLARLCRADFIVAADGWVGFGGDTYVIATALTERGMRASGEWPTPENLSDRILAAVETAADSVPDPAARSRIKTAVATLGQGVMDTGANVMAAAIAKALGLTS